MRARLTARLIFAGCLLVAIPAAGQQSHYAPARTLADPSATQALNANSPPGELPRESLVEARPLVGERSSPVAGDTQPPFPFRQVSSDEDWSPPTERPSGTPLKLAPRSDAGKRALNRPAMPTAQSAVGTVVGSLAIVVGLFLVVAWCTRRFSPPGTQPLPKEVIESLGRAPLGPRQQMHLVRVGNRLLLIALSSGTAETLSEITDPVEVERLAALCRRGQPASASASFSQVLGQITSDPVRGGFAGETRTARRGGA